MFSFEVKIAIIKIAQEKNTKTHGQKVMSTASYPIRPKTCASL